MQGCFNNAVRTHYLGNGFNESNIVHLELDMKELRSQLQDEKRYSMELKKELDRLHGLIANQAEISEVWKKAQILHA